MTVSAPSGRAVVIGASMAGLLAARALSESHSEVVVLDRDELPADGNRKGVPQGLHAHALLAKGREVLEELFPGLTADLVERGGVASDMHDDALWFNGPTLMSRAPSGLVSLSVSRPTLENYVRARVAALPGVAIRPSTEAVGLLTDEARAAVTGVRVLPAGGQQELLTADLVIDATGRGNRGVTWLAELGYQPPAEDVVRAGVVYGSREYRRTAGDLPGAGILLGLSPEHPSGGVLLSAEDDRWILTMAGLGDDIPPVDEEGFNGFAARMATPEIHNLITRVEPLTDPLRFRVPASVRRRYERLALHPANYLAFGDALCAFNPIYGQGMTVAAIEATVLRDLVEEGTAELPRRFYRAASKIIDTPWDMAVGGDLAFPSVEGKRTLRNKVLNVYIARLLKVGETDPVVALAFLQAMNLMSSPERLMAPRILRRVLFPRRGVAPKTVADLQPAG